MKSDPDTFAVLRAAFVFVVLVLEGLAFYLYEFDCWSHGRWVGWLGQLICVAYVWGRTGGAESNLSWFGVITDKSRRAIFASDACAVVCFVCATMFQFRL